MKLLELSTTELAAKAAPYNPRQISDHDLDALRRSLKFFGTVEPIVVNERTGHIVGGHQRVKAAEAEGIETLPVVHVDLDEPSEKQLNLALNKISGEFDLEKLSEVLGDLQEAGADLGLTGFTDDEIEELCAGGIATGGGLTDPDDVPEPPDDPATQLGDVIVLGNHRLLCGDATHESTVSSLVGDLAPAAMWTDPPYGVDYTGKTSDALTIQNDGAAGLSDLLHSAFRAADTALCPGAPIYVAHPAGRLSATFHEAFTGVGWRWHQTLVWVKQTLVLGHSDYHYRHEPILFGYKPGEGRLGRGGSGWYGDNAQDSVFEVDRPMASREHPTSKPVELVERCLANSTKRGALVYEPFGGSGSTLIACERLGRACMAVEIDPRYCDVIVQRWQEHTGRKAEGWRGNA